MLLSYVKFLLGCLPITQHQNFEKNIIVIYKPFFYWNFTNFLIKNLKVKCFFPIAINEMKKLKSSNFDTCNVQPKYRNNDSNFHIPYLVYSQLFLHLPKFLWMIATLATNKNSFEKHCYQPTNLPRWETLFIFSIEIKIKS
jgi:hypothetical protein